MFWDKKEDDKKHSLPDLPSKPLKANIFSEEEIEEKHSLPTFPDSPLHNSFSQAAIKDAVNTEESPAFPTFPSNSLENSVDSSKTIEMEEWTPKIIGERHPETLREIPPAPSPTKINERIPWNENSSPQIETSSKDIFVKIEKFRIVKKMLKETQEKLNEIDSLLARMRDIKMREEQELAVWEKEISAAKARIQDVTSNIFDKVE